MYDLTNFTLGDMTKCGSALRRIGTGAKSMEKVAERIVRYLYENLIDKQTGEKSCVLVRFYKTQSYGELDEELREFARSMLGNQPKSSAVKCLTLLATAGAKPEWNSRANSVGHKSIPLPSEKMIAQFPMISQLIHQFGLEIGMVLKPDPALLLDLEQKTYNVFHVSEAVGSPYIPAQEEFVIPFKIKSVLGFGGMLSSGNLFVVILFSKVHISQETANMVRTVAVSAKMALLPFEGSAGRLMWEQPHRLEQAIHELRQRAKELELSEEVLRNQNKILQSIFDSIDSMSYGVVVADENGKFLLFNKAAERIVGIGSTNTSPDEWSEKYGVFFSDAVTPFPANELPLVRAIRGEESDEVEIFIRNPKVPNGVYISVAGRPLKDEKGTLKGGVVVFRETTEITKRKRTK